MKENASRILFRFALQLTLCSATLAPAAAAAADINFSGHLDVIQADIGGAVYSGVPIGTNFSGAINDATFGGFVTDGTTMTPFNCCIAAGGLSVTNNEMLDADSAALINAVAGTSYIAGDTVDLIDIEGDAATAGGGRIEIGLSFVLDPLAFDDNSLSNYPPDPENVAGALFFIVEFDDQDEEIYNTVGALVTYDGDRKADILWRNSSTGQNWVYRMNGADIDSSEGINTVIGAEWEIVGTGDYDGDGRRDILWRNTATGQNWMYLMVGSAIDSSAGVNTLSDLNWKVIGSGDFDGDGNDDILWRHEVTRQIVIYFMNGPSFVASVVDLLDGTRPDTTWQVVQTGDYNGDDICDLLWRNENTGQIVMYLMTGAIIDSKHVIATVSNTDWEIVGGGDYDGDNVSDILWRNHVTGQNWVYLMDGDGTANFQGVGVNYVIGATWRIVDSGDYDGDGNSDMLWRNFSTGQIWMYLMNGATIDSSVAVITVSDQNWDIVGDSIYNNTSNNGSGPIRFRITFDAMWTAADFPTNFPGNAHFSPIVGTAHNQQVEFWQVDGQPATNGIESMAESGGTAAFGAEINAAESSGYSLGVFLGSGIGIGDGETSLEFNVSINYPLISFVSMVAPSPDWFVGVNGFSLLDGQGEWKTHEEILLKVYDAGTDLGLQPTSPNQDSNADNLPITLLSSDRADTDFDDGVHFQNSKVIGKFIIDNIEP